jgi:CheY-like chemotaxis protein
MRHYLIADDNRPLAENLAEILVDALGARVEISTRGDEALGRLKAAPFDTLITDVRMPGMSGAELLIAARRCDPTLPAIVITASSMSSELERARRQGVLAVLPKPVPIDPLLSLLLVARRGCFVLVIEDRPSAGQRIGAALSGCGFSPLVVASMAEALGLGGATPLCAGVVDLDLADCGDAHQALELLTRRYPGVPFLGLTAQRQPPPGFDAAMLLEKPVESARLRARLEALRPRS